MGIQELQIKDELTKIVHLLSDRMELEKRKTKALESIAESLKKVDSPLSSIATILQKKQ